MSRMTEEELAREEFIDQISREAKGVAAEEFRQSPEFIRSMLDDQDSADVVCDLIALEYPDLMETIKRLAAGSRD